MYGIRMDFVIGMNWNWVLISPILVVTWTSQCLSFLICKAGIIMLFFPPRSVLKIKWDDVCVNWVSPVRLPSHRYCYVNGGPWSCAVRLSGSYPLRLSETYLNFKVNESNLSYHPLDWGKTHTFLKFPKISGSGVGGDLHFPDCLLCSTLVSAKTLFAILLSLAALANVVPDFSVF